MSVHPSSFVLISSNPHIPAIIFTSKESSVRSPSRYQVDIESDKTESQPVKGRELGKIIAKVLVLISLLALTVGLFALVVSSVSFPVLIVASVLVGITTACFISSLVSLILKCLDRNVTSKSPTL